MAGPRAQARRVAAGERSPPLRCTRRRARATSTTRCRSSPRAPCPTCATASSRCSGGSSTRCGTTTGSPRTRSSRKCAKVVGDVLGNYHPHGDTAVYDAMVRMAQDFSLRYPLVDGHGNFGSLDGDSAAAMRYTECRLQPLATELLAEIGQERGALPAQLRRHHHRAGRAAGQGAAAADQRQHRHRRGHGHQHPAAQPRRGVRGAARAGRRSQRLRCASCSSYIKGPDFPTGGQVLNSKDELREIYETGQGSIRVRGEWTLETLPRGGQQVVITSIPYTVNKSTLIAKIAELVVERKLAPLIDVRDESHRGRADRAGAEAGRRPRDGHGVPLQAHAAADQLPRQPDLPRPEQADRRRHTAAPRPEGDAAALPRTSASRW